MTSTVTSAELLNEDTVPAEQQSWWNDSRQDVDAFERPCTACHGRGLTRWEEDCPECGGMGVLYS